MMFVTRRRTRAGTAAALFAATLGGASLAPAARAAEGPTPDAAYAAIKRQEQLLETRLPLSTLATVSVGVYDAAAGTFEGRSTHPVVNGRVRTFPPPRVNVAAIRTRLRFAIDNADKPVTVVANGSRVTVPAGSTSVSVDVGRTTRATWRIASAGRSHASSLLIAHEGAQRAGAFTVRVLPIGVVYEPPQPGDGQGKNSASVRETQAVGTSVTVSLASQTSTTRPAETPFETSQTVAGGLRAASKALQRANPLLSKALGAVASSLGSAKSTTTKVEAQTRNSAVEVTLSDSRSCETDLGAGPGRGDAIAFYRNARIAWFDDGTRTRFALIGFERERFECRAVQRLQQQLSRPLGVSGQPGVRPSNTPLPRRGSGDGLDADTIRSLLALDPLAADPNATLAAERFDGPSGIVFDGTKGVIEREVSVSAADEQVRVDTTIRTDQTDKALLSVIGIGPKETKTVTSTLTMSSALTSRRGKTITARAELRDVNVDVYYDRLFGTFAFQAPRAGATIVTPPTV